MDRLNSYRLSKIKTGKNWKNILFNIYKVAPHSYGRSHKSSFNDDNHPLAKDSKISGRELMLGISFLRDQKLIDETIYRQKKEWTSSIILTEKGFSVALDLEKHFDSSNTNTTIIVLTIMIVLTSAINMIINIDSWDYSKTTLLLIYSCAMAIVFFIFLFQKRLSQKV